MLLANEYPENPGYAHLEYYARDAQVYYTQAIGYKALGRNWKAKRMFRKALEQRNDNLWANYYLGNL